MLGCAPPDRQPAAPSRGGVNGIPPFTSPTFRRRPAQARPDYWRTTGVWRDIHDVFELVLKQNPDNRYLQTRYMYYAAKCGQWRTVERLVRDMHGEVCTAIFGDRRQYEKWMQHVEPQLRALKEMNK